MARKKYPETREQRIAKVERELMRHSSPRLQVSVIFAITGLVGFLTSFVMLQAGIHAMWLRYAVAILIAYGAFLLLLRLWLWMQRRSREDIDVPDLGSLDIGSGSGGSGGGSGWSGGGGNFGGGGASGSWGEGVKLASMSSTGPPTDAAELSSAASSSSSGSGGSFLDNFSIDADEGIVIILALIAILGGVIALCYIIYIAPALLAEILVDGALLAGLYNRVKTIEQRHWLRAAIRKTIVPVLIAAACFTAAGYFMQMAVPEARSIGQVWRHFVG
jgi:hypothetical protein